MIRTALPAVFVSLVLIIGCGNSGLSDLTGLFLGDAGPNATGTLRLLITDKPFPVDLLERAEVTITRIDVLPQDTGGNNDTDLETDPEDGSHTNVSPDTPAEDPGANATDNSDTGDDSTTARDNSTTETDAETDNSSTDSADPATDADDNDEQTDNDAAGDDFLTISQTPQTFNLLDLQNGASDILAETEIPVGTYKQMRLLVSSGYVRLVDGREFDLRVPSGSASGIKLHFEFEIDADDDTTILLDFDLSRAFKPTPAGAVTDASEIREFKFQPSLGMRLSNLGKTGDLSGTVTDNAGIVLENVLVTAYSGTTEVTSTTTTDQGQYTLKGLPAGIYRLEFSATGYTDADNFGVNVTPGLNLSSIDATLTAE